MYWARVKYKTIILFLSKNKNCKDGLSCQCKICAKQYDLEHKETKKQNSKKYYIDNKQKINLNNQKWHSKNKESVSLRKKKWRSENPEEEKLRARQQYLKHKEQKGIRRKQHYLENKKRIFIVQRKYENNQRKNNPIFRIKKILRSRMHEALKKQNVKKTLHTIECLGCTPEFFQNYIQSLFKPGMNLANNGKRKWVLHHIKYCCTFDLLDPEQQKLCFHYANTIPMWEDEHDLLHKNNYVRSHSTSESFPFLSRQKNSGSLPCFSNAFAVCLPFRTWLPLLLITPEECPSFIS